MTLGHKAILWRLIEIPDDDDDDADDDVSAIPAGSELYN